MKRIRLQTLLLVQWLILLFTIERLDFNNGNTVNLASFFYVLVAATVVLLLGVRMQRRQVYWLTAALFVLYGLIKALQPAPDFAGVHKFLTISEIAALAVTISLTWPVSRTLQDFEHAVEAISLPEDRPPFVPYTTVQKHLQAEMRRARRHQRPISVAMLALPDNASLDVALHQAVHDAEATLANRYVQVRLGMFLSQRIRSSDMVAFHATDGRFVLLAPETAAQQTNELLARLSQQASDQIGVSFRYSIADFPDGALTSEELLKKASGALDHKPEAQGASVDGGRPDTRAPAEGTNALPVMPTAHEGGMD